MKIAIIPFSETKIAERVFFEISDYLPFNCQLSFLDPIPVPMESYNPQRRQYNSSTLIELLKDIALRNRFSKAIGIANVDIYCKNSSFIFGHAELNGISAVVSIYRLNGDGRVFSRTLKEVLHELGHLFGLKHCINDCVMRFSETLDQLDSKNPNFCTDCLKKLQRLELGQEPSKC
ncbi:MAG TPA: hypothetical protein EYP30_00680 [Archaeoglobaceae archaeon]|nr:hypothetical protein [Archaeoglobaceae archaeon]